MLRLRNLLRGVRSLLDKRRANHEIDEEIDSFLEASIAHKQRSGMTREQARRAALAEMGSRNVIQHRVWSTWWESAVDSLHQDIRVSLRGLAKKPAFTVVALLSLALGIGANTAIFTLIHQTLLRSMPVRDPNQLVTLGDATNSGIAGGIDLGQWGMFPWDFARQLAQSPGPFQGIAAHGSFAPTVTVRVAQPSGSGSESGSLLASAELVSGNYFSVLDAPALMGRTITAADDATPGSGAVAVASFHFWQTSLASDPGVVGKTLLINGTPFELIGVMPRAFEGIKHGLAPADLWTPSTMETVILQQPSMLTPASGLYFMNVFARLSPQAAASKAAWQQSQNWLDQQVHAGIRARDGGNLSAERQKEIDREDVPLISAEHGVFLLQSIYGQSLKILMAVVVLVLLIACANLANFLLARAAARQREIATRLALGSSRSRIARQSLIETLLLSIGGGLFGLGVAFAGTRALIAFVSEDSPWIAMSAAPDLTVLLFTLGICMVTAALFGLAPAIAGARTEAQGALSSSSRTSAAARGKSSRWWAQSLVVGQVMLSLLLLVAAGLFLRTLHNLQHQDYGFERTSLLVAEIDPRLAGYTPLRTADLHQRLLQRLEAIPGVESAALAGSPPISSGTWRSNISIAGYAPAPKENLNSVLNRVSGRYFETVGIRIVAGRPIAPSDALKSTKVAVVNETLARHFFPKGNAVGHALTIGIDSVAGPWQIVGIARDTRSGEPRAANIDMMTYIPLAQIEPLGPPEDGRASVPRAENNDCFAPLLLLRTHGDPSARIADLRAAVASVDPNLPLLHVSTISQEVSRMMSNDELSSSLTTIFALLALVLAAIGLYGVMSYNVVQRTNEIGIRLALGAQQRSVLWIVLREALLLLGVGAVLGLPLSLLAVRLIRGQLFGLPASDPVTYGAALMTVAAVVILSAWLPARRAAGGKSGGRFALRLRAAALLIAEHPDGVDSECAADGDEAGEKAGSNKNEQDHRPGSRVEPGDAEEERTRPPCSGQASRGSNGECGAEGESGEDESGGAQEDQRGDIATRGADGNAEADFAGARGDHAGERGVEAEAAEKERDGGEDGHDKDLETLAGRLLFQTIVQRAWIEQEQSAVDAGERRLDRLYVFQWVASNTEHNQGTHEHGGLRVGEDRHGQGRLHDGVLLKVGEHADDFAAVRTGGIEFIGLIAKLAKVEANVMADRVHAGEISADEGLIHERDEGGFEIVVSSSNRAAGKERNAERFETSWLGFANASGEINVGWVRTTIDFDGSTMVGTAQRNG